MTYTIRLRGAVGCPKLAEFACDDCGIFESTVTDTTASMPCEECGADSPRVLSAAHTKVDSIVPTAVVRGGDMKDCDRPPGMLSTRELADGMSMKDWKAKQDGFRRERNHKKLIARGLKSQRIQSSGGKRAR